MTISRISGKTRLIGLLGSPVSHSRSPVMQNSVFEAMDLDFAYIAFDVAAGRGAEAIAAIRTLGLRGSNVTMPLKREVIPHLDRLTPAADLAGAVNVIVNDDGVLTGHVTDGEGFMLSLDDACVAYEGRRMVILGAGGAAIAVTIQAAFQGVAGITLFNRRDAFYGAAEDMLVRIGDKTPCDIILHDLDDHTALAEAIAQADILINATPIGMEDSADRTALPDLGLLRAELTVCDLIYAPRETHLLKEAAARGCKTVSGIGMQLYQAVPAFRMWTGRDMDIEIARKALFSETKT